jgi:hypothetical protein
VHAPAPAAANLADNDRTVGPLLALDHRAALVPGAPPRRLTHNHFAFDHSRRRAYFLFFHPVGRYFDLAP